MIYNTYQKGNVADTKQPNNKERNASKTTMLFVYSVNARASLLLFG